MQAQAELAQDLAGCRGSAQSKGDELEGERGVGKVEQKALDGAGRPLHAQTHRARQVGVSRRRQRLGQELQQAAAAGGGKRLDLRQQDGGIRRQRRCGGW